MMQQPIRIAGFGLAANDRPACVEAQGGAHDRADIFLGNVLNKESANRRLDAPPPDAKLLVSGGWLVARHHVALVALPQITYAPLGAPLMGFGFRLLPLPGSPLPQRLRPASGPFGLAQPPQLLLRAAQRPAPGRPAEPFLDLPAVDGDTQGK